MMMFTRLGTVCALLLFAVVTTACGDSKSSMNPVAPTAAVVDTPQGSEAGAAGAGEWGTTGKPSSPGNSNGNSGNGNGNSGSGNGNSNSNGGGGNGKNEPPSTSTPQIPTNTTPTSTRKVEIEGLISAKGSGSITVNAQTVTVPADCVIRHGNTRFQLSDLKVGDRVHVKGLRTTTGTGATATTTIAASEVKLQNPGSGSDDDGDDDGDDDDEEPPTQLVSVTALDATAAEAGPDLGAFAITRAGDTTTALTVTIVLSGTATNGTDYQNVPLTVTFAAGQATANVLIVPLVDAVTEGSETVILTVLDGTTYTAGAPAVATVTIAG